MTKLEAIVDGVIVLALIVVYCILTVTDHDGTPVLLLLGGAAGRTAVQSTVAKVTKDGAP